ncbi:MAG: prepilin-type N-terminal cleavage/methylation domain-containing protein [Planctomycetes bacterium]|nr:prepilin-type N-terminal cleavage/methylation domain-containing protein [Planctomycetota bacterium]
MKKKFRQREGGFTLIELIVVIAIIVILAAIIVPVVGLLTGGKKLSMTGNAVDAYIGNLRSKALTTGNQVVVVVFPRNRNEDNEPIPYQISAVAQDGITPRTINFTSGFIAFERKKLSEFDPDIAPRAEQIYRYMGVDLNFDDELDNDIRLHPAKVEAWKANRDVIQDFDQDIASLEEVGALLKGNAGFFFFVIHGDGRVEIPNDIPVPIIEEEGDLRDADIIFEDGESTLMIDISRYAKVTSRFYRVGAMDGTRFAPPKRD